METSATNRRIRNLVTAIRDETLKPNPEFQRRLVWSTDHKLAFIKTVLDELPFPEIFIAAGDVNPDTGDGTEVIVDGQQRISTLYQYFTGSQDLVVRPNGDVPVYADLSDAEKRKFLEYQVVIRDLGPLSEAETREVFVRINSTAYSLNAMEINNSRFDGSLKRFAEHTAELPFFEEHKVFSNLDGRRMNDVRFVLTAIITMLSGYFNGEDAHEEYLEQYNDDFPQQHEVETRLTNVLEFIESGNFATKSRIWRKADLLTALVELDRILNLEGRQPDPSLARDMLEQFYSEVEIAASTGSEDASANEYSRRVRAGVNQRVARSNRGDIVGSLLRQI